MAHEKQESVLTFSLKFQRLTFNEENLIMRILKITQQNRRDFYAKFVCEHCNEVTKELSGYDDVNFHENVIPKMVCQECGKTASADYQPNKTKYPEGFQV